jgi:hypothetical protein
VQALPKDDDERGVRRTPARLRPVQESSRLFEQNVKNSTISARESELTVMKAKVTEDFDDLSIARPSAPITKPSELPQ